MTTPQRLALSAVSASAAACVDLTEFARHGGGLTHTDVVENACDAAKLTIEATHGDEMSDEVGQVYGAICRFLEGQ